MMTKRKIVTNVIMVVYCFVCFLSFVFAEEEANKLVGIADGILTKGGGYEYIAEFRVHKEKEADIGYTMQSYIKGTDKILVIFLSPPRVKDQAILRDGDDQWLYFPNLKKTMKISSRNQLLGSDFSYGDILNLNLEKDYDAAILKKDAMEEGVPCYQLELKALTPSATYDRIIYYIRNKDCAPIKREFYTKSGKKLKFLIFKDHDNENIPRRWEMSSVLNQGNLTTMIIKKIQRRDDISNIYFTIEYLRRGR